MYLSTLSSHRGPGDRASPELVGSGALAEAVGTMARLSWVKVRIMPGHTLCFMPLSVLAPVSKTGLDCHCNEILHARHPVQPLTPSRCSGSMHPQARVLWSCAIHTDTAPPYPTLVHREGTCSAQRDPQPSQKAQRNHTQHHLYNPVCSLGREQQSWTTRDTGRCLRRVQPSELVTALPTSPNPHPNLL